MTTPLAHGYPDFLRVFASAQTLLLAEQGTILAAPDARGPFATVNMHSIEIAVLAAVNHLKVGLHWHLDEAGLQGITADELSLRQGDGASLSIAVKGPFLRLTLTPTGAPSTTFNLQASEVPTSNSPQTAVNDNILISQSTVPVGAGATVDLDVTQIWPAEARWVVTSALATWTATLDSLDSTGTRLPLDTIDQTRSMDSRTIFLPPTHIQSRFTNTTGGAGTFSVRLIGRAFGFGR